MRYQVSLFILVCVIGLVSVGLVQGASGTAIPSVSIADSPAYPYDAEITGDNVYVRTGPGTTFYDWGKLYKGDKVKIMGDSDGVWSKIQPLEGSFSWISAQYVEIEGIDPTIGKITGDNVRVWAGSPLYSPERSTTLQGKLSKGDKVKLLGQPVNNYYKIAVPSLPDAYYWVSTQYTKPIPRKVPGVVVSPNLTISDEPSATSQGMASVIDSNTVGSVELSYEPTALDKYYDLQKQMEAERSKPLAEQDYSSIKESFLEIVNDENAGKASIYAQSVLDRIAGIELALEVKDIVKKQNEQFNQNREKIEKAYTKKLEEIQNLGRFAVIGTLQTSLASGAGNYRIVDESDKNICYAMPSQNASVRDLSGFIGKKVGLVGTIEPDTIWKCAMVRFTEVVILE